MRVALGPLIAAAVVGGLFASCDPWIQNVRNPVLCPVPRATVTDTIGPAGGTVDAGYASAVFASGTFREPTEVMIEPHPAYHGFRLDIPALTILPEFTARFDIDFCGTADARGSYQIVTEFGGAQPASVERGIAQRVIAVGEITAPRRGGVVFPDPPLAGGFVILSN